MPGWWAPAQTLTGATAGSFTSWALFRADGIQAATIAWETQSDLDVTAATPTLFTLHQQETVTAGQHTLGRCRLAYTPDSRADLADGLARGGDVSASGSHGATFTALGDSSVPVSGSDCCHPVCSVAAATTAGPITGFRLDVMKDASLPSGGPGREASAGNFPMSGFIVSSVPEPARGACLAIGRAAMLGIGRARQRRVPT